MRERALELLDLIEKEGLAYIFHRSKPKAVMLSMDQFGFLQEMIEDYQDEKEAKKLSKTKKGHGISLGRITKKYA